MKIVKISWIDSTSEPGWHDKTTWKAPSTDCVSVGFLLEKTDDHISICQSYHEDEYGEPITIPLKSITEVQEIL